MRKLSQYIKDFCLCSFWKQYETWLIKARRNEKAFIIIPFRAIDFCERRGKSVGVSSTQTAGIIEITLRTLFSLWLTFGYVSESTNWPSIPNRMTETKHVITPNNIIVLHTGCDCWITLWKVEMGKCRLIFVGEMYKMQSLWIEDYRCRFSTLRLRHFSSFSKTERFYNSKAHSICQF